MIEVFPETFGPLRDGYVPAVQYLDGPEAPNADRRRLALVAAGVLLFGLIFSKVVSK